MIMPGQPCSVIKIIVLSEQKSAAQFKFFEYDCTPTHTFGSQSLCIQQNSSNSIASNEAALDVTVDEPPDEIVLGKISQPPHSKESIQKGLSFAICIDLETDWNRTYLFFRSRQEHAARQLRSC